MKKIKSIAELELDHHIRWAKDVERYEVIAKELSTSIPHPETVGTSSIYSSKLSELFDLEKKNHWATFVPPDNMIDTKRCFSHQLLPESLEEKSNLKEPLSEETNQTEQLIERVSKLLALKKTNSSLEKDKDAVFNLLHSIEWINKLLTQINARKLQYQKG